MNLSKENLKNTEFWDGINVVLPKYDIDAVKNATAKNPTWLHVGGGNIFRGLQGAKKGIDRIQGDYMGLLATVINSIAIKSELEERGYKAKLMSGIPVEKIAEAMTSTKAIQYLEEGNVVIVAGGTGNPFFTTDSGGALRALEIKADLLLKGTRVDGVYDKDPEKFSDAVKYDVITFDEAIDKNLKIMDQTAFTLCKENNLPIVVFNINQPGNLARILKGEKLGTIVKNK